MAEDSSSTEEESVRDARTPQKDQVEPQKENAEPQKDHAEPHKDNAEPQKENAEPHKDNAEPQKENEEPQKYHVNENAGRSENGEMESVEDEQEEERVCGEERTREISKESLGSGQNLSLKPGPTSVMSVLSTPRGKKL